jgi:predicted nucleic acid-binding protein
VILVDTSVWIDYLRRGNPALAALLLDGQVLTHPWVTGEIALANLSNRVGVHGLLGNHSQAAVATDTELRTLIDRHRLNGRGIGYVDAQLLAATMLTSGSLLWSRDKRLAAIAAELGIAHDQAQAP